MDLWVRSGAPWARGIADNRRPEKGARLRRASDASRRSSPAFRLRFARGLCMKGGRRRPESGARATGATRLAKHKFAINDKEYDVEVGARQGRRVQVSVNGKPYDVELR